MIFITLITLIVCFGLVFSIFRFHCNPIKSVKKREESKGKESEFLRLSAEESEKFAALLVELQQEKEKVALELQERLAAEESEKFSALLAELQQEKKKVAEYFATIEGVIKERENWRNLYNDQAAGHENAAALMLQTISNLSQLYHKKTGYLPQMDPMITQVLADWQLLHGSEARKKRDAEDKEK